MLLECHSEGTQVHPHLGDQHGLPGAVGNVGHAPGCVAAQQARAVHVDVCVVTPRRRRVQPAEVARVAERNRLGQTARRTEVLRVRRPDGDLDAVKIGRAGVPPPNGPGLQERQDLIPSSGLPPRSDDRLTADVGGRLAQSHPPDGEYCCASWRLGRAIPIWCMFFAHLIRAAASRTFWTAGSRRPIRVAVIAITSSSSIGVNPLFGRPWRDRCYGGSRLCWGTFGVPSARRVG